ncbi:MAG: PEP-CTERM sorting domain-containing protein [Thermoguttaceae bacterium]
MSSERVQAGLISDGGFEDPVLSPGAVSQFTPGQSIGGAWTVLGNQGTNVNLVQTTYSEPLNNVTAFNAEEGLNSVDLTGTTNQGPSVGIEQSVATTAGQQYALSFFVGRVTPTSGPGGPYSLPATVDLSINGGTSISFTNSNITDGMVNWMQLSDTFVATGSSTTIAFLNGEPAGDNFAGLDNVVLTPSPEPTTLALLGSALLGLAVVYLRRLSTRDSSNSNNDIISGKLPRNMKIVLRPILNSVQRKLFCARRVAETNVIC